MNKIDVDLMAEFGEMADNILARKSLHRADSWKDGGLQAIAQLIRVKMARLTELSIRRDYGEEFGVAEQEDLLDTFLDMYNYSRMGAVCLAQGLWFTGDTAYSPAKEIMDKFAEARHEMESV
jgi:hypothetical protein